MIAILQLIGLVVSFAVAGWARLKLKSRWVKVLFFFVAVIAGNVVYLGLGVIWAMADPATLHATARAVGLNGWQVLGSTIAAAFAGLVFPLVDGMRRVRKSK